MKKLLLLIPLSLIYQLTFAQNYNAVTHRIDSLIRIGLNASALTKTNNYYSIAVKNNDPAQQIKAAMYRIKLQANGNEDGYLVVIDTLKKEVARSAYPARPVLLSFLAQAYRNYLQQFSYKFYQRSHLDDPGADITQWDQSAFNKEISRLFVLSLSDREREQQTPANEFSAALIGDTSTRAFRPTLYDLLLQQALSYFLNEQYAVDQPKQPVDMNDAAYLGDSRTFANINIKTTDTTFTFYRGLKYLQQATQFHLQRHEDEAVAALDMQRLEFVIRHADIAGQDSLYISALKKMTVTFASKSVSADAWVLLGRYYKGDNYLSMNGRQTDLRLAVEYFNKAIQLFPGSLGAKNAEGYLRMIKPKQLSVQVEDVSTPDKPILNLLRYQNMAKAKVIVYKIPDKKKFDELSGLTPRTTYYSAEGHSVSVGDSIFRILKRYKPLQENILTLPPDTQDYRIHTTEFKTDRLKPGNYAVLVDDPSSTDTALTQMALFRVSRLSFVTRRLSAEKIGILVTDRETDVPIAGVKVKVRDINAGSTDAKGYCVADLPTNSNYTVELATKNDTLYTPERSGYYYLGAPNRVSTVLFTDRVLYRPGQTVYYKGIEFRTEDGKSSVITDREMNLDLADRNGKTVSSATVRTNEFGTFSGSFVLPQNLSPGAITLRTLTGIKQVRMEEYKRPGFEAHLLPVKEVYHPGDSVTVRGKVTAYSGFGLSTVRVAYKVSGSVNTQNNSGKRVEQISLGEQIDTIQTDAQGNFSIKFKAKPYPGADPDEAIYSYGIHADITGGNDETRFVNADISLTRQNIEINNLTLRYIKPDGTIPVSIANLDGMAESGKAKATVYSLKTPGKLYKRRLWSEPDQHILSRAEFEKDFPDLSYDGYSGGPYSWDEKDKISDTTFNIADGTASVKLPGLKDRPSGYYKIEVKAENARGDTDVKDRYIYLINGAAKPQLMTDWLMTLNSDASAGKKVEFLAGVGGDKVSILVEKMSGQQLVSSKWYTVWGEKQQLITVPVDPDEKNITLSFLMVYHNRMYSSSRKIKTKTVNNGLDIKLLTFRDKLEPGEKEEWKIQVSARNGDKPMAELLAGMYDASLDELGGSDSWQISNMIDPPAQAPASWQDNFTSNHMSTGFKPIRGYAYFQGSPRNYEQFGINFPVNQGMLNSVSINGMPEIVYKTDTVEYRESSYAGKNESVDDLLKRMEGFEVGADGSVIYQGQAVTKARLNGRDYAGSEMASAMVSLPADMVQSIQMVDDYGDQAGRTGNPGNKILNITAKGGPVIPVIVPRTKFNETAFFYPQLHTDSAGQILIDFTMPDALTRWKFRALAQTKDLKTGYFETEVVTQKQLSISANMPRFLREGDTISVTATIANLTVAELKGKVNLQLFNAMNMQPVALLTDPAQAQQDFDIAASSNRSVSFKLAIPSGLDALTYRITVASDDHGDGEENTIPVLPDRMLVTESMPMMVRPGQTKSFNFDKLLTQQSNTLINKSLTLEYTPNPVWYAVQAMPYMMEFPYECSEQTFDRFFANTLGTYLVNKMPVIKKVFDQWKNADSPELLSKLEKNEELKSTLIEETPWLRDAANESEQKKRIALLFDLNKMNYELQQNLDKLRDKQLPDGGFAWFAGDMADGYITRYILQGMGQLYKTGALPLNNLEAKQISDKAMSYTEGQIISEARYEQQTNHYNGRKLDANEIHEWYAESYFTNRTRSAEIKALLNNYLAEAQKEWLIYPLYEQGMIALTLLRNNKPDTAQMIIRSLIENAKQSGELGMYWDSNRVGYMWDQAPIETQSLMIELFTEAGGQQKAVDEMKIWLLRNKQTSDWKTTKATAQACYALLIKADTLLNGTGNTIIKLGGKALDEMKPDLKSEAGTGYIKATWANEQVKPDLGKVEITNNSQSISWGALYWQYTEKLDKITSSNTNIRLERKYYIEKQTASGTVLIAVDAAHPPKTGDIMKVVVDLKADRDFEYVQLKDMRPAGTEPVDVPSAYKYQDGLYYYQVTKDVATNFFISRLNKGNYVFEYRLRVAQPGNYSTGISSIQSMYAPEFSAHSEGMRMTIGK